MPARPVTATRRTALAVAVGVTGLAVGGCTADSPDDPADPAGTTAPPVDADQVVVDDVLARLNSALAGVAAAGAASRPLARELAGLKRAHVAHLEALGGSESGSAGATDAPTRREVLKDEARLQRFLATASVSAESGTLATLLASMSASVAQHLALLA